MMGTKARPFTPVSAISLDELVPADHFYRHLDRALDLSFVRELVREEYAGKERPSIDPVVFFKLQLVMFFEGIRSERQLLHLAADRLSVRWYLGYNLDEPVPDQFEPDAHPRPLRPRGLPPLLRRDRRAVPAGRASLGPRAARAAAIPPAAPVASELRGTADRGRAEPQAAAGQAGMWPTPTAERGHPGDSWSGSPVRVSLEGGWMVLQRSVGRRPRPGREDSATRQPSIAAQQRSRCHFSTRCHVLECLAGVVRVGTGHHFSTTPSRQA
jgi:hypothetical protein